MAFNFLIVDDSKTIRAVIEKTLHMTGVPIGEVHHAGNGQEALDLLESHWVDLIFADINMPVMNGVEMIQRMHENGVMQSTPVVVVSTEGSTTRIEQLKQLGVTAYLRKPFQPEQFSEIINDILGKTNA